jgi:hypothetical protein
MQTKLIICPCSFQEDILVEFEQKISIFHFTRGFNKQEINNQIQLNNVCIVVKLLCKTFKY